MEFGHPADGSATHLLFFFHEWRRQLAAKDEPDVVSTRRRACFPRNRRRQRRRRASGLGGQSQTGGLGKPLPPVPATGGHLGGRKPNPRARWGRTPQHLRKPSP